MGKTQRGGVVDSPIGTITENPAVNRDPNSNIVGSQTIDDGFVQRLAIPLVVFADVDPHHLGFTLTLQGRLFSLRMFLFLLGGLDDCGVVHLNQSVTYHGLQFGKKLFDFLRSFDELDLARADGPPGRRDWSFACDDLHRIQQCHASRSRPIRHGKRENPE